MRETERELSRVLHELPDEPLDPQLMATVHRRIVRRRRARYAAAGAATLIAAGGVAVGLLAGGSSGTQRVIQQPTGHGATPAVVPWVDEPATPPPPPPPPTPPPPAYPACHADQLAASAGRSGAATGHLLSTVTLTNTSHSDCSLSGRLTSFTGVKPNGARTAFAVPASSWSDTMFAWPADLHPGDSGGVGIDTGDACQAAQVPGGLSDPVTQYTGEVLGLPGGGTLVGHVPFNAVCGVDVTSVGAPQPAQPETGAYPGLQAAADLPPTAAAGSTLTYTVTLTNTGEQELALDPCPVYTEIINTGVVHSHSYRLNCSTVHAIGAGDSVRYQMRVPVPTGRVGTAKFGWSIRNSANAFTGTTITITAPGSTNPAAASYPTPAATVTAYYQALATHDGAAAAALLAPEIRSQYQDSQDSDFTNLVSLTDLRDIQTATVPIDPRYMGIPSGYTDVTQVTVTYTATYKQVITAGNGTQTRFLYVGRRKSTAPWRILSIGTGP